MHPFETFFTDTRSHSPKPSLPTDPAIPTAIPIPLYNELTTLRKGLL